MARMATRHLLTRHLLQHLRPLRPHFHFHFPRNPQPLRLTSTKSTPEPVRPTTLSARLKHLSREYGYSALGVYLLLSALDFPFCFLTVRYLGTEKISKLEASATGFVRPYWVSIRTAIGYPPAPAPLETPGEGRGRWDDVKDAEEDVKKGASIWTELALAYAIHKSFIFARVPLTAVVTPKVVRVLRSWGWVIGKKGKPKTGGVRREKE